MMTPSATNLSTPYAAVAIYYEDADYVEYVRADVLTLSERVDRFLTLIYTLEDRSLIGFRLNGFKSAFLRGDLKSKLGDDFVTAVQIIERVLTTLANETFDKQRRQAYNHAVRMAVEDRVELRDLPDFRKRTA
jgi:hypothetical protein